MAYVFLEHPSSLAHDTSPRPGETTIIVHPDQPRRILAIERELSERGWLGSSGCALQPSTGLC